jgi:phosphoribosylamine-glycine ligase
MKIIGLVAGIRLDEGVADFAEKQGLYVLGSSGDAVEVLNSKDFKPKIWG